MNTGKRGKWDYLRAGNLIRTGGSSIPLILDESHLEYIKIRVFDF